MLFSFSVGDRKKYNAHTENDRKEQNGCKKYFVDNSPTPLWAFGSMEKQHATSFETKKQMLLRQTFFSDSIHIWISLFLFYITIKSSEVTDLRVSVSDVEF